MAPKVLFVLTSHDQMGNTGKPTGWYLPEFAHPYQVLAPHVDITVASPNGGASPLDPSSIDENDKKSMEFLKTKESLWKNTVKLSTLLGQASQYEAIFFVGGHGPMFDLATDETSHKLINEFHKHNKIVSAVCHGPAALAYVKLADGSYLVKGKPVTAFSNTEEDAVQLSAAMPFMLEDQLKSAGAVFTKAKEDWGAHVVVSKDGRLITGQNPASAEGVGEAIKDAIFGDETTRDEI